MVEVSSILTLLGIVSIGLVTPGPNNLTALIHAGLHGPRSNARLIVGMATGFILLQILVALLVDRLQESTVLALVLHGVGVTFMFALAFVVARLRPDRFERSSIPRLGFKAGFAMQWVNGKEWGFVILYMTLLLDDFGGGWLGSLWIISIVTTVCILAIITWTVAGQRMERWMTDPAIAPRLFPALGGVLALLGALIAVRGP